MERVHYLGGGFISLLVGPTYHSLEVAPVLFLPHPVQRNGGLKACGPVVDPIFDSGIDGGVGSDLCHQNLFSLEILDPALIDKQSPPISIH